MTCFRNCECRERGGGACANFHCLDQCTNKVEMKPPPATEDLRATLHFFFPTLDKAQSSKDKEDKDVE